MRLYDYLYFTNFYLTIICIYPFIHFPTCRFQFRVMGGQSLSWQLRVQGGHLPWQDAIHGRAHSYSHPQSLRLRPCGHTNVHIFGVWEETRVPGGNPYSYRECLQAPHRRWPHARNSFFSCHYNKWCWRNQAY